MSILHTNRLVLRTFHEDDAKAMYKNWTYDERVARYCRWYPHKSIAETEEYLKMCLEAEYSWVITLKDTDEPIGAIDLVGINSVGVPEIGYVLSYDYWGKGIMTEAVNAVIGELFRCGFDKIGACHNIDNPASGRVMQKCGMVYVRTCMAQKKFGSDEQCWVKCYEISKNMQHSGTKAFETKRLICRPFIPEDYEDMFRNWAANPNIQYEYGEPVYTDVSQVKNLLKKYIEGYQKPDFYRWAIVEKASNENIGQIAFCKVYSDCLTAEIEYCIGEPFWGKGYAGEALAGLIDFTFKNTDFLKLEAYHRCENVKSGRVLSKSEMQITDTVERFVREKKLPVGEVCYCINKNDRVSG